MSQWQPAAAEPYYGDDTVWLDKAQSGFRGVPEAVWNFHIGGYQVRAPIDSERLYRLIPSSRSD